MDALLFAAGLGTRLRPLTNDVPKALVEVAGVPMLERVARRLVAAGADRLIVNVHHHAEQIEAFLDRTDLGAPVRISREPDHPLETGGGLVHAAPLFRKDAPFLIHNTDILTDIALEDLYRAHAASDALATLAVMERDTSRYLLFDRTGLCGYENTEEGERHLAREPDGEPRRLAFSGVHAVSPAIFDLTEERGVFSIMRPYLRLAAAGHRVGPYRVDDAFWMDIGTPERLEAAERAIRERERV